MPIIPEGLIRSLRKGEKYVVSENPIIIIEKVDDIPDLINPVFMEGLPGIGYVGYTTTSYIVKSLNPKVFLKLYMSILPAQVSIRNNGLAELISYTFYYYKGKARDFVFMLGDAQPANPQDQYLATLLILEILKELGVREIVTVGGYGKGTQPERPKVYGAATDAEFAEMFSKYGVVFSNTEPEGGIIGITGLLIGLGKLMGFRGVCLMGETSGMFRDPKAAREIVKILNEHYMLDVDMSGLEKMIMEFEKFLNVVSEISSTEEKKFKPEKRFTEEFRYIR
ncbi:MAG: proteasome assembly chaperone family protein [Thermoplasmata archaeon]|nr:PAC2 family protein [Euryarchaeota archaeon]RLF66491.1 MAG: proteasome assembly chaperone family protein [Thermoplasmata archaeon]